MKSRRALIEPSHVAQRSHPNSKVRSNRSSYPRCRLLAIRSISSAAWTPLGVHTKADELERAFPLAALAIGLRRV
jgi:hypothetical protein